LRYSRTERIEGTFSLRHGLDWSPTQQMEQTYNDQEEALCEGRRSELGSSCMSVIGTAQVLECEVHRRDTHLKG
jgi:hypothetical protein